MNRGGGTMPTVQVWCLGMLLSLVLTGSLEEGIAQEQKKSTRIKAPQTSAPSTDSVSQEQKRSLRIRFLGVPSEPTGKLVIEAVVEDTTAFPKEGIARLKVEKLRGPDGVLEGNDIVR